MLGKVFVILTPYMQGVQQTFVNSFIILKMGNLLEVPHQNSAKPSVKGILCQECCINHESQVIYLDHLDLYAPHQSSYRDLSNPSSLASEVQEPLVEEKSRVGMKAEETLRVEVVEMALPGGGLFIGQVLGGIPEGEGEERYPSGEHYKGQFRKGLKHGKGCYTFSNEQKYEGDWQRNQMHGYGKLEFMNGDWYQGQFKDNHRHGKGRYYARQPNQEGLQYFEGQYVADIKHGMGMMKYHDHQFYGLWQQGKFHHALNTDLQSPIDHQ